MMLYGLELASAARMRCSEQPTRTFQATMMLQMLYLSRFPLTDSKLQQDTAEHSKASKLLSTKNPRSLLLRAPAIVPAVSKGGH
jgi:hypothetical protein